MRGVLLVRKAGTAATELRVSNTALSMIGILKVLRFGLIINYLVGLIAHLYLCMTSRGENGSCVGSDMWPADSHFSGSYNFGR